MWEMLIGIIAALLSGIAVFISVHTFYATKRDSAYSSFDEAYMMLLTAALEHPHLRNMEYTKDYKNKFSKEDLIRYEIYAHMCWNFCETIYDKSDKHLIKTWLSAIYIENQFHRGWFEENKEEDKFKKEFTNFILKEFPK